MNNILFFDWGLKQNKSYRYRFNLKLKIEDAIYSNVVLPTREDYINTINAVKENAKNIYLFSDSEKIIGKINDIVVENNDITFDLHFDFYEDILGIDGLLGVPVFKTLNIRYFGLNKSSDLVYIISNTNGTISGTFNPYNTNYNYNFNADISSRSTIGRNYINIRMYDFRMIQPGQYTPIYFNRINIERFLSKNDAIITIKR